MKAVLKQTPEPARTHLWKKPPSMNSEADGTYTTRRPVARPQSASVARAMLLPLPV